MFTALIMSTALCVILGGGDNDLLPLEFGTKVGNYRGLSGLWGKVKESLEALLLNDKQKTFLLMN